MKKIGIGVLLVILLSGFGLAQALEMGIGGWNQNIDGDVSYNPVTVVPDTADLEDDLGLDDETRGMGWLKLDMPMILPNIYLGVTPMQFEGTGRRTQDFTYGDYTFQADQNLKTDITMDHLDVGLFYSIPFLNLATLKRLNVDLGINIRTADLDAEITGTDTTTGLTRTESESYTLPIPMLYAAVQVTPVEKFSLEAEARGISMKGNHLLSALGRLKVKIKGPWFVAGGYRYDDINLDEDDLKLDTTISGAFVETGLAF